MVVIAIIALLMGILMPALARVRQIAFRMVCGSNLSGIGRAMLIYAMDYDDDFPRAGYTGTIWADEVNWSAPTREGAFYANILAGQYGQATITSSFYNLVKYAEVTPKSFVCKGERNKKAFQASDYLTNFEDEDAWDFGPTNLAGNIGPYNHCSYSYHMPYNQLFLSTASSEPGMAVAADRNPWLDWYADTTFYAWNDYTKPAGESIKGYQFGNAAAHQREGQNVLFMDNHVTFEKQSFCGVDEDNIYSIRDPVAAIQQGVPPVCDVYDMSQPTNLTDSLLVNECGPPTGGVAPPPPPPPPP